MTSPETPAPLSTLFVSHGAGPAFFVDLSGSRLKDLDKSSAAAEDFRKIGRAPEKFGLPARPDAIVVVSAHWEESDGFHVYAAERPPLYYDYGGFPPESYELRYDAPGDARLASEVRNLIAAEVDRAYAAAAGGESPAAPRRPKVVLDTKRVGWDHGVFLPLLHLYPSADIPVVQVSLWSTLDPQAHVVLGRALEPLRHRNIFVLTSGEATHPGGAAGPNGAAHCETFVAWVDRLVRDRDLAPADRVAALARYSVDPAVAAATRSMHPRTDHLVPLLVAAAAAGGDAGTDLWGRAPGKDRRFMNGTFSLASWRFGGSAADARAAPAEARTAVSAREAEEL